MQINKTFKMAKLFYKKAFSDLRSSLKELSSIVSFQARIKFCTDNFTKVAAGSGRITFWVDSTTALKLAKNQKGIAQNRAEADGFLASNPVANGAIDSDPNDLWVLTKLAKKTNKGSFQSLTGIKFDDYCLALNFWEAEHNGRKSLFAAPPNYYNEIKENEFFQDVTELAGNMELKVGDLCRINSYGEIDGKIKIIDLGLTRDVYEQHYMR